MFLTGYFLGKILRLITDLRVIVTGRVYRALLRGGVSRRGASISLAPRSSRLALGLGLLLFLAYISLSLAALSTITIS